MKVGAGCGRQVQDAAVWSQLLQYAARRFRLVQHGADKYEMLLLLHGEKYTSSTSVILNFFKKP